MARKPRFRNEGAKKGVKVMLDPPTLKHLYLDLDRSQASIAREYGCSPQFVSQLLSEYNLPRKMAKSDNGVMSNSGRLPS